MAETARRPLPAGWGWSDKGDLAHVGAVNNDAIASVDRSGGWTVWESARSLNILQEGRALDREAGQVAAEDVCWERGLFGAAAVPPEEPPWRWGAVEFTGNDVAVGRFYEEAWCGTWRIVVDALNEDGTFKRSMVPVRRFEAEVPMTEDAVRAAVLSERAGGPCDEFTEPSARPGRCRRCGHDKAAHEAKRAGVPWEPGEVQVAGD